MLLRVFGALAALVLAEGAFSVAVHRPPSERRAISSSAVAVSPDGSLIAAVNPDSDSITVVKAASLKVIREIPVGRDPRTLCFSEDSRTIAVANHGSGDISLIGLPGFRELRRVPVGPMPYGVAMDADRLFVSEFAAGSIAVIDVASGSVAARVATDPYPAGLAITPDRKTLLVTHFFSGRLSVVDIQTLSARSVVETGPAANISQFIAISTDGRRGYLPQTLSDARARTLNFDTTIIPTVNVVDLSSMTLIGRERLHMASPRRGANRPFAAVVSPEGSRLYIANAGSDDVLAVRLPGGEILAYIDVGANPQGLALSPDGALLYVDNVLDGTLSVIRTDGFSSGEAVSISEVSIHRLLMAGKGILNPNSPHAVGIRRRKTCASCHVPPRDFVRSDEHGQLRIINRPWTVEATVRLTRIPLSPTLLKGKKIFNSSAATELSMGRWISCASCHPDGGMDARTWLGFSDGPRNTPALFGGGKTLPLHWSGDLDEFQDMERTIRRIQFGKGLVHGKERDPLGAPYAGSSPELDALAAYLTSLQAPSPPAAAAQKALAGGAKVFAALGCLSCHPSPTYSDGKSHAVGIGDASREKNARGLVFDTPSLRTLWLTAPYFHDGSAPTLEKVLKTGREHDVSGRIGEEEARELASFLRSL